MTPKRKTRYTRTPRARGLATHSPMTQREAIEPHRAAKSGALLATSKARSDPKAAHTRRQQKTRRTHVGNRDLREAAARPSRHRHQGHEKKKDGTHFDDDQLGGCLNDVAGRAEARLTNYLKQAIFVPPCSAIGPDRRSSRWAYGGCVRLGRTPRPASPGLRRQPRRHPCAMSTHRYCYKNFIIRLLRQNAAAPESVNNPDTCYRRDPQPSPREPTLGVLLTTPFWPIPLTLPQARSYQPACWARPSRSGVLHPLHPHCF